MIEDELRRQFRAVTADDVLPDDLAERALRSESRRRSRRRGALLAATAATALALPLGVGALTFPDDLQRLASPETASTGAAMLGPDDAELAAAQWWHYRSQPYQPDVARAEERRWESRDGRHVALGPDGADVLTEDRSSGFPLGADWLGFDELQALDADPDALADRLGQAEGGRPVEERALDQARYLLGRSPALWPVRRALVDVVADLPGVTQRRDADSQGRPATVFIRPSIDGTFVELLVDVRSARLLEERVLAGPQYPAPPTQGPVPTVSSGAVDADGLLYRETYLAWSTDGPTGAGPRTELVTTGACAGLSVTVGPPDDPGRWVVAPVDGANVVTMPAGSLLHLSASGPCADTLAVRHSGPALRGPSGRDVEPFVDGIAAVISWSGQGGEEDVELLACPSYPCEDAPQLLARVTVVVTPSSAQPTAQPSPA